MLPVKLPKKVTLPEPDHNDAGDGYQDGMSCFTNMQSQHLSFNHMASSLSGVLKAVLPVLAHSELIC